MRDVHNPLKERDETLAVLDAWGNSSKRKGSGATFGRWMVVALVAAGCLLAAMALFPALMARFTGA